MNNLGLFSWFGYRLPLEERLKKIAGAGFDASSIWLGPKEGHFERGNPDRMPELVREAGLILENAHAPFVDCNYLWSDSAGELDRIMSVYESNLDFCGRHGIPVLVIHVTSGNTPPPVNSSGLETIGKLAVFAEECGVRLAIENTRTPDRLDEIFTRLESPALAFCYDSSHDFLWGKPPGSILKKWGHILATTHFSDNAGKLDNHKLPGNGCVDWEIIGDCFPRDSYPGVVSLEVIPERTRMYTPERFLELAFERAVSLRKILQKPKHDRIPDESG